MKKQLKKQTRFSEKKECERCHFKYPEDDLDLVTIDGNRSWWLCRNCEYEVKEGCRQ